MIEKSLEQLYTEVGKLDPDAEKYLREDVINLPSYAVKELLELSDLHRSTSVVLLCLFKWNESEQGSKYWCNLWKNL